MPTFTLEDLIEYEYDLIDHPQTRWAVDDNFNLYIVPPITYNDEVHGPDNEIKDKLRFFRILNSRTPTPEEIEGMGLLYIEPAYRRHDPEDGYYYR